MLQICRFFEPGVGSRLAVKTEDLVYDLTASGLVGLSSLITWLELVDERGLHHAIQEIEKAIARLDAIGGWEELQHRPKRDERHLLAPLDFQEVWGAGVTYYRSREAREDESNHIRVYDKVYDAQRPEIFFKATPHRIVGPYAPIRARSDSNWSVPEPELTVVLTPGLEIVGCTVGNDVSSRDIEGENPLYLTQAKIYLGSCALGPVITLAPDFDEGEAKSIELVIRREGEVVFEGRTSTDHMKRTVRELVAYLGRENEFPHGVLLMTGTGVVPPDDYTMQPGDLIEIDIERIGQLVNPVGE